MIGIAFNSYVNISHNQRCRFLAGYVIKISKKVTDLEFPFDLITRYSQEIDSIGSRKRFRV
jgi:hypothetical protein